MIIDDDTISRLIALPNVLITAHQAFLTREALEQIAETTLQNISDFEQGEINKKIRWERRIWVEGNRLKCRGNRSFLFPERFLYLFAGSKGTVLFLFQNGSFFPLLNRGNRSFRKRTVPLFIFLIRFLFPLLAQI